MTSEEGVEKVMISIKNIFKTQNIFFSEDKHTGIKKKPHLRSLLNNIIKHVLKCSAVPGDYYRSLLPMNYLQQ